MILRLRVGFLGRFGGRVFLMKLLALEGSCGGGILVFGSDV
jgi:hypothetical protein